MWANAQPDGRPAEYRWRLLFIAAKFEVWLTPTTRVPCSNTAKTRNPLKIAGVPQTRQQISAVSRPKFTILSGHVEEVLLFNKFFSDCRYSPTKSCDGAKMAIFLRPVFPASRVLHIAVLHSKFALGPHYVWKHGRHPIYGG